MKKAISFFILAITALIFTSCNNEDNILANALDGIWEGEVRTEYFNYRWHETVEEFQTVDIEFYKDPYRYAKGEGVERDYTYINERTGVAHYVECGFWYEVKFGVIYIYYDDGTDVQIYNYSVSGNKFTGVFRDRYGNYLSDFVFYRVNNWRNDRYRYTVLSRSGQTENAVKYEKIPSPALKQE